MAAVVLTLTATFRLDATAQRPPNALRETLAGIPVPLDALEDRVDWCMGLSIAVEGHVDDVLGPRLFRVADRTADGEMLVGVLAPAVAPVRTGDLVRSGVVPQSVAMKMTGHKFVPIVCRVG